MNEWSEYGRLENDEKKGAEQRLQAAGEEILELPTKGRIVVSMKKNKYQHDKQVFVLSHEEDELAPIPIKTSRVYKRHAKDGRTASDDKDCQLWNEVEEKTKREIKRARIDEEWLQRSGMIKVVGQALTLSTITPSSA